MSRTQLPPPQDEYDRQIFDDIERTGWSVILIHDDEGTGRPDYAFSAGLFHRFGHPEILVSGTTGAVAGKLINTVGALVKVAGSKVEPGVRYTDVTVLPVQFVNVDRKYYRDYVGYLNWMYGGTEYPLLQLTYPDEKGLFPWEPGWNATGEEGQELLGLP